MNLCLYHCNRMICSILRLYWRTLKYFAIESPTQSQVKSCVAIFELFVSMSFFKKVFGSKDKDKQEKPTTPTQKSSPTPTLKAKSPPITRYEKREVIKEQTNFKDERYSIFRDYGQQHPDYSE